MLRRARIYTGPVTVNELCERAIAAGYTNVKAGTEHMYLDLNDSEDGWGILDATFELEQKLGCKLGKISVIRNV
jgi:hypothetical protein